MDEGPDNGRNGGRRTPSYLPYLTWTLLVLLFAWFLLWFFHLRPTTEEQRRLAAFRTAMRLIPKTHIDEVDQAQLYQAAMEGMVRFLQDQYSAFVPPRERERIHQQTEGEFGGIGVLVTAPDGEPVIVEVGSEGPAARAGLQERDILTHVEGEATAELGLDEVVQRIRGQVGTTVNLTLQRPATDETIRVSLKRELITIPNVTWRVLDEGPAYLQFVAFDRHSTEQMAAALGEIRRMESPGLVLDLRNNAGGLIEQAFSTSDLFLPGGEIVTLTTRTESHTIRADRDVALPPDVPIVVLVDAGTASAAEILAGALQANGRATVVGAPTRGKGSFTELTPLPDGSAINLTVGRYILKDGRLVEGKGIEPDVVVGRLEPMPRDDPEAARRWFQRYEQSRQEQLQRAIEVLGEKLTTR